MPTTPLCRDTRITRVPRKQRLRKAFAKVHNLNELSTYKPTLLFQANSSIFLSFSLKTLNNALRGIKE